METDQRLTHEDRAACRSRQITSFLGIGLFKDGQMVAGFGVNHNAQRTWTSREIEPGTDQDATR